MDKVIILDFGSQTTQLIGRRIRDFGVYTEIYPGNFPDINQVIDADVKGLILSGSPFSSYEENAPVPDQSLYNCGLPILGICYGFQRMTMDNGGLVEPHSKKEYGRTKVHFKGNSKLTEGLDNDFISWMSHGDSLSRLGQDFELIAESFQGYPAIAVNLDKQFYGLQFHPEVTHTENGTKILENFVCGICGAERGWSIANYVDIKSDELKAQVGDEKVLLLISGGVDSTVTGALLLKALDPEQVYLMYIDTGMMRKGETEKVATNLKKLGATHLMIIDAEDRFLSKLSGVEDPEQKRKIIGDTFIHVQEEEIRKHFHEDYFLAQGTLYTDLIESGKGVGDMAGVIKSHHNVGTPLVEAKRDQGRLIEPLDMLYKDEVRRLGTLLGLEDPIVNRHPFPGPGLGIRIIGEVNSEKCRILREADKIYIEQLHERGLYNQIWQAFSVLLPVRSVGVAGDFRKYGYVLALRAVVSHDGMTADVYDFPYHHLMEISALITNTIPEVGRVVYDVSSKPPATIEWE